MKFLAHKMVQWQRYVKLLDEDLTPRRKKQRSGESSGGRGNHEGQVYCQLRPIEHMSQNSINYLISINGI